MKETVYSLWWGNSSLLLNANEDTLTDEITYRMDELDEVKWLVDIYSIRRVYRAKPEGVLLIGITPAGYKEGLPARGYQIIWKEVAL